MSRDSPKTAGTMIFSRLPMTSAGEVRVGATFATALPVTLGVPYPCKNSDCSAQFWYAADDGVIAFPLNSQIASIEFSLLDSSTTTPYAGAGFRGAPSSLLRERSPAMDEFRPARSPNAI